MPKTSKSQRLGRRNRKEKREHFKNVGVTHGYKAKRLTQSIKRAAQEVKGTIGLRKGRTVFQLMLTKGPMYSYEEFDWGKRIANTLEISQEDANEMVRKAKYGKIVLMESEDKTTLEKTQYQLTSGIFGGVSENALKISEK